MNSCPRFKSCVKNGQLQNAPNRQKMAKIETLSLVSRLLRALISKFFMSAAKT